MQTPPKRRRTLVYVLAAVILLLVVAVAVRARQRPKGEEVTVEAVEKRSIRETVSASGKIFPETEVKISSDVSGEVVELYVKEGDSVTVGQILAKIKPDEYQSAVERGQASVNSAQSQRSISNSNVQYSAAQIEQMRADRARVQAQVVQARNSHQRNEQLYKEQVISQSEFEASLANLNALESSLSAADAILKAAESSLVSARENVRVAEFGITSARASLKELRTSLQKTVITAPVSGIISKLNIERGERVVGTLQMTGTEMMRIANMHSMEVQVDVSENDILKVTVGDTADIEVDAYLGRKFRGKVSEIANSASNVGTAAGLNTDQVTNFVVKIRVDPYSYRDLQRPNQRSPFRPGMSASVDVYTEVADSTLSVPIIAVTAREKAGKVPGEKDKKEEQMPGKKEEPGAGLDDLHEVVFLIVGDTVAMREVQTGIQDNDYIQVLSGLQQGDRVVTGPYAAIARKLKSGSRVHISDKKEKEANSRAGVRVEVD